jgi:hypothetical protein
MAPVTVVVGLILVGVGLVGFLGGFQTSGSGAASGALHPTALIPAYIGLVLIILGGLSFKDSLRKHTMHAASAVGLLAFLVTAYMGVPKLITMLQGGEVERPGAVVSQVTTAGVCLVFVALCVNSFIAARRRRLENANKP